MIELEDSTIEKVICALLDALKLQRHLTNLREDTIRELRKHKEILEMEGVEVDND